MSEFRDIKGFEGLYQISDSGDIKSLHKGEGRILKPSLTPRGYLKITLSKNGVHYNKIIHKMVAEAFLNGKSECINHRDGNKINNSVGNLEWTTNSLNRKHAIDNGLTHGRLGIGKGVKVVNIETGEEVIFPTRSDVARFFGHSLGWFGDMEDRHGNSFIYKNYYLEGGKSYGRL